MKRSLIFCLALLLGAPALARDLDHAPPSFGVRNGTVVPIDITSVHLSIEFDYRNRVARGAATVRFTNEAAGFPLFDLVPSIKTLVLDGVAIAPERAPVISDPDRVTKFRALQVATEPGEHTLELTYNLLSDDVAFSNGRVRAGFFMSDLTTGGRRFFERYGPANIEFDQIPYTFDVSVTGASRDHVVYTNGDVTAKAANSWSIDFPDYFTTSSLYFHITEKYRFYENQFVVEGAEKDIPVTVYSSRSDLVKKASSSSRRTIAELEGDYGPMLHDKVVIYVTPDGGGMEYGGATMTSMGALGHEITHFWFARGVMPSKANSGWIDEATASWRDRGYYRSNGAPNRSPVNLGGFSPYRRHTSRDAYTLGRQLMSEFDYLFRDQGGMKPVLKVLFDEYGGETINLAAFKGLVEQVTGHDLTRLFNRYVLGRSSMKSFHHVAPRRLGDHGRIDHPQPYTEAEMKTYR